MECSREIIGSSFKITIVPSENLKYFNTFVLICIEITGVIKLLGRLKTRSNCKYWVGDSEVDQWLKVFAVKGWGCGFHSQSACKGERRELIPQSHLWLPHMRSSAPNPPHPATAMLRSLSGLWTWCGILNHGELQVGDNKDGSRIFWRKVIFLLKNSRRVIYFCIK